MRIHLDWIIEVKPLRGAQGRTAHTADKEVQTEMFIPWDKHPWNDQVKMQQTPWKEPMKVHKEPEGTPDKDKD